MKILITYALFLFSAQVFCSPIVSLGTSYNFLSNKALDEQDGSSVGSGFSIKVGTLNGKSEYGLYFGNASTKITAEHDDIDNTIKYNKNDFGVYSAYYGATFYFELGFGQTTIEQELVSSLSAAQETIFKDIYNLKDQKIESFGGRFLIGAKLFEFYQSIISFYLEQQTLFTTDHRNFSLGLELKVPI